AEWRGDLRCVAVGWRIWVCGGLRSGKKRKDDLGSVRGVRPLVCGAFVGSGGESGGWR
ncbi:hypothetical protein H0E87_030341, partial [Populus deltoides]